MALLLSSASHVQMKRIQKDHTLASTSSTSSSGNESSESQIASLTDSLVTYPVG